LTAFIAKTAAGMERSIISPEQSEPNMKNQSTTAVARQTAPQKLADHNLCRQPDCPEVLYQKRPATTLDGQPIEGLYNAWITLNNPAQYNSYTTSMVKAVILAFRQASNARDVASVVFTGAGDKAFCTGGNTKEYAEYYAGNPEEYRQYMRLFNDMVSGILACDKPVICRVNGMRIGGGQAAQFATIPLRRIHTRIRLARNMAQQPSVELRIFSGNDRLRTGDDFGTPEFFPRTRPTGLASFRHRSRLKIDGEFVPNPLVITDRFRTTTVASCTVSSGPAKSAHGAEPA
jgi:6-oxo-cyclohex-1-ene-carbonyl-CoA hydrolase